MNNYRKISFDIDFAGKKVLNTIQMPLEELTQNDFNSSLLTLKLMQGQELINLQGLSVVLNFLMPSGKDYVDTINAEMIDIENSIVSYSIPKDILSEVGMVVGTVSLYKEGYRYTSIVQFKFEVVSDFVEDGEIVESDNYPILAQMIGEVQNLKDEEMKRVESEIERIENEEERESSELQREMNEVERHEAENVRIINEQNREVKELERDQAERLREANSAKVKREEETRLEAETLRVQAESLRVGAESDRIQAESIRQMQESDRHEKELERQAAESLRVLAEIEREQKQNEFNARAEEVAVRIEEESQRISDLVEIEESKLVKPRDMMDYMGNQHNSLKEKADSDVDYAVKTAIGEFNYLDYEGQHITATSSIEGHARSAILKGNTLVNLVDDVTSNEVGNYSNSPCKIKVIRNLQNETLTIIFNVISLEIPDGADGILRIGEGWSGQIRYKPTLGVNKVLYNCNQTSNSWLGVFSNSEAYNLGQRITISDVMVLEGDYTNIDISYFEGMQSVRMPVLTTVGKNLFDGTVIKSSIDVTTGEILPNESSEWLATDYIDVKDIKSLYFQTGYMSNLNVVYMCFDSNKKFIGRKGFYNSLTGVINPLENTHYIRLRLHSTIDLSTTQIEQGTQATSYEPFKSNILTVNEDVVLCGIGDVKDELNLITGELTQRIGEGVLDGSEDWFVGAQQGNFYIYTRFPYHNKNYPIISDKIPTSFGNICKGCLSIYAYDWGDAICFTPINAVDKNNAILELQSYGDIVFQYVKKEKSAKTVDLSDNVVYSYNGTTHYSCSSEEGSLVPTLSVKVPTDVQEVISEQRKIISEQEEAQNILIDSQLSLYESISGVQTLQTDGEEVQMPQYIIDLYELAYKRGVRKKGER